MKSAFATVGTTSFDDFVQSLCSPIFLNAMAQHHASYSPNETTKTSSPSASFPSSLHSQSLSLSASALEANGPSSSSCLISPSLSLAVESSSTCFDENYDISLELTIQYGRGQCPHIFLPPSLVGTSKIQRRDGSDDDGSGSIILSFPIESTSSADEIRGMRSTDESSGTHTNKSTTQNNHRIRVRWYRFQPSLSADMERADIILCHAGAGTLLEALAISASSMKKSTGKQKIINAVINSTLMNNHQRELADELGKRNHICVTRDCVSEWTTEDGATIFWEGIGEFAPLPFLGGPSRDGVDRQGLKDSNDSVGGFQRIVDRVMGFHESWSADDSAKKTR